MGLTVRQFTALINHYRKPWPYRFARIAFWQISGNCVTKDGRNIPPGINRILAQAC